MIVVRGKRSEAMDAAALAGLRAPYTAVTIDVGAGDGRFAYRYARSHPERFVIGMDPVAENMAELSGRAARKPGRGGAANVLYAVASIERVPDELRGIADEVFVTLPWGSLMRGLILGDDVVLAGLASLARDGAALRIVLNTRIFDDPVPAEARDLPELTPEYATATLTAPYARHGIRITEARFLGAEEVAALPTTWAKRLSHRAPPRTVYVEGIIHG
ncbi:MAG TPA: class I SAM-dependent methyltransferase [Dehalococcoidia bacterium]|nr:class I SAM-dependent methyltransferase [Dehalococcoidia bacterium]